MRKTVFRGGKMRRKYYLHKRNGVFYAELVDPVNGQKLSAKSTGESNKENALLIVSDWLKNGIPSAHNKERRPAIETFTSRKIITTIKSAELTPKDAMQIVKSLQERGLISGTFIKTTSTESELFCDFISRLWAWDSPFIREKIAYNHKISKRHCKDMVDLYRRHWDEKFKNVKIGEIKREDLKNHLMHLKDNGLSVSTLNQTLNVIAAPMSWAYREGLITSNPTSGIKRFSGNGKRRDILTTDEIRILNSLEWQDVKGKLAFLVSLTCGLRLGEVAALRLKDIGEDRLYVRHSWARVEGLKSTKNGEERETPLLPELRDALKNLAESNPWEQGENAYIFFSPVQNKPINTKALSEKFTHALNTIGIDESTRKERNIVFHSLRHNFTKSLSSHIDQQTAMRATGHKTAAMFSHYADHKTEEEFLNMLTASTDAWGTLFIKEMNNERIQ
jgi:integrase